MSFSIDCNCVHRAHWTWQNGRQRKKKGTNKTTKLNLHASIRVQKDTHRHHFIVWWPTYKFFAFLKYEYIIACDCSLEFLSSLFEEKNTFFFSAFAISLSMILYMNNSKITVSLIETTSIIVYLKFTNQK